MFHYPSETSAPSLRTLNSSHIRELKDRRERISLDVYLDWCVWEEARRTVVPQVCMCWIIKALKIKTITLHRSLKINSNQCKHYLLSMRHSILGTVTLSTTSDTLTSQETHGSKMHMVAFTAPTILSHPWK